MVYGRALSALVPLLADHRRFELDVRYQLHGEEAHLLVTPPVLLPPLPPAPSRPPSVAERLAGDLSALGHAVEHAPYPLRVGEHLLFPDFAVEHRGAHWLVEVLGFSTQQSLAAKLALYRRADAPVLLCVDRTTAATCDLEVPVCGFTHYIDVDDFLAAIEAGA
jgi:predicted nuclease of restriction endonuclease-like RecB superfamily